MVILDCRVCILATFAGRQCCWKGHSLGLNPISTTCKLCDFEKVTQSLCASLSSFVNGTNTHLRVFCEV